MTVDSAAEVVARVLADLAACPPLDAEQRQALVVGLVLAVELEINAMSKDSAIGWTDHTFNPWWGCFKVSPGCQSCYAEAFSKRTGHDVWGPPTTTSRRLFGEAHWREPLKWDVEAGRDSVRRRVFCASMADVFEDHPDVWNERNRLWDLIAETRNLDWLLLTKRPENFARFLRTLVGADNIWLGVTAEDQQRADERIPLLLETNAAVRFVSYEPALGPVDLSDYLDPVCDCNWTSTDSARIYHDETCPAGAGRLHWIIAGEESGRGRREAQTEWFRSMRDQCAKAGVSFFLKQWHDNDGVKVSLPLLDGQQHAAVPR